MKSENSYEIIFNEVVQFVLQKSFVDLAEINEQTNLREDLKLQGSDAYEFIDCFSQEFNLDTSNFDFNEYFYPEGQNINGLLINKKSKKKDFTVGDMVKCVKEGILV